MLDKNISVNKNQIQPLIDPFGRAISYVKSHR